MIKSPRRAPGGFITALVLAIGLSLSATWLAACGSTTVDAPPAPTSPVAASATLPPPAIAETSSTASVPTAPATAPVAPEASSTAAASEPTPAPLPTETATMTPTESPPAPLEVFVNLEPVATGLTAPVALVDPADGSGRLFVADQIGLIRIILPAGGVAPQPLLDLRARMVTLEPGYDERGLLGLALHPEFATVGSPHEGELFVYYSAPLKAEGPTGFNHTGRVASYRVDPTDPNQAMPEERVILEVPQPQFNHNGGQLAFGPDGMLYVGLGDGGAQYDFGLGHGPAGNAQDPNSLLGKILRLDVSDPAGAYVAPPDNPYAATGRPEIYALGFRNPYRFSFDGGEGALFVADVGQDLYEEVNLVERGGNYGWRLREGDSCFNLNEAIRPLDSCAAEADDGTPLSAPILVYDHSVGRSVIGGYVYRGEAIASLRGRYVFGDWQYDAAGLVLFSAVPTAEGWVRSPLSLGAGTVGVSPLTYLLGFGQDAAGELYALTSEFLGPTGTTGQVLRLVTTRR